MDTAAFTGWQWQIRENRVFKLLQPARRQSRAAAAAARRQGVAALVTATLQLMSPYDEPHIPICLDGAAGADPPGARSRSWSRSSQKREPRSGERRRQHRQRGHHRRQRNRPAARRRIDRSVRQPVAIARTIDWHPSERRLVCAGGRRGQRCRRCRRCGRCGRCRRCGRCGSIGVRIGGLRFESIVERRIAELSE
jgi:hypothetical protein